MLSSSLLTAPTSSSSAPTFGWPTGRFLSAELLAGKRTRFATTRNSGRLWMTSGTKPHGWALNRGLLSFFVSEVADLSGTNLPGPDSVAGFCEKSCFGDFIYRSDVDGSLEGDLKGLVLMMGGLLLMGAHFAFVRRTLDRGRSGCAEYGPSMDLAELQDIIERTYGDRDRERGVAATVAWLAEEVGELAQAVRKGTQDQQIHEFGDVIAWIATLANQQGIDLTAAAQRFADGCPKCTALPCAC